MSDPDREIVIHPHLISYLLDLYSSARDLLKAVLDSEPMCDAVSRVVVDLRDIENILILRECLAEELLECKWTGVRLDERGNIVLTREPDEYDDSI